MLEDRIEAMKWYYGLGEKYFDIDKMNIYLWRFMPVLLITTIGMVAYA